MFSVDSSVDSTQQKKETMNLKIVQKKLYKLKGKGKNKNKTTKTEHPRTVGQYQKMYKK